ncbi:hypothetical protein E2C01_020675 [Portunus trituberculatus]|uniref:Uncharacterized protein n=1 Tax=Portunus trituberculatus TaxID=210409 RepID=A0A5B7E269_PORTR|nr:hypothetical protein [Portunus trituberculatus]
MFGTSSDIVLGCPPYQKDKECRYSIRLSCTDVLTQRGDHQHGIILASLLFDGVLCRSSIPTVSYRASAHSQARPLPKRHEDNGQQC